MDSNQPSDSPSTVSAKKPYEKPSFRFEKVFVTTALSCGKTSPINSSCQGPSLSAS